jgi:hypothetical protein
MVCSNASMVFMMQIIEDLLMIGAELCKYQDWNLMVFWNHAVFDINGAKFLLGWIFC